MKILIISVLSLVIIGCTRTIKTSETNEPVLKEVFENKFLIGAALNADQIWEKDTLAVEIINRQFNAIVAENCMKSMYLQPQEGEFYFNDADKFVEFGVRNRMFITGHCLIWHSQAPGWFFTDDQGNDVSKEILIERMKNHITTIVSRYKGIIKGWDVVNEAFLDDGSWRDTQFYKIIGEDYIPLAFRFANEADPDAELYYNDYNEWHTGKREAIVKMIKQLKEEGLRIDAIGMQGHIGMDYPDLEEYRTAINAYTDAGVKVMITELELSALPSPRLNIGADVSDAEAYRNEMNPYTAGLPDSVAVAWTKRMAAFFNLFIDNKDKIKRITLWGVTDANSWKNDFPIHGRTDYPLLFDREYKAKPIVKEIIDIATTENKNSRVIKKPRYLVPDDYMADPAVHAFNGKLYIYPSHDRESGIPENDNGDHFDMKDYHVFSLEDVENGEVTDHGVILDIKDIPWAGRQLWDCDVAYKNGKYYLYFPLKDKNDVFRIGVAVADRPEGPFVPQPDPIRGSYSIDPCILEENGDYYIYFGGLWGGQLQRYRDNKALENAAFPEDNEPAIPPRIAKLSKDMLQFAEEPQPVVLLDKDGDPITHGDNQRRFFEASWVHKYNGKYYFSYSTGDTHLLCYATGDNPYGPFVYQGVILTPVVGWTTHHAIVEYKGKWYLFFHDSVPSGGKTWLRSLKVVELTYRPDGTIQTIEGE